MPNRFNETYAASVDNPTRFWGSVAESIHWDRRWDSVLDDTDPPFYRWFAGGQLNTCYNALDLHIECGRGKQTALIYDSPVTNTIRSYTYSQLRDDVALLAGALVAEGIKKGDRVIIYMPMIPEAAMAMLACARIGAVHSVVFGGFASKELSTRIDDAKPRLILSASCGIEVNRIIPYKPLLDEAIDLAAHKPDRCLIMQRPQNRANLLPDRDIDWNEALSKATPAAAQLSCCISAIPRCQAATQPGDSLATRALKTTAAWAARPVSRKMRPLISISAGSCGCRLSESRCVRASSNRPWWNRVRA